LESGTIYLTLLILDRAQANSNSEPSPEHQSLESSPDHALL